MLALTLGLPVAGPRALAAALWATGHVQRGLASAALVVGCLATLAFGRLLQCPAPALAFATGRAAAVDDTGRG